MSLYAYEDTIYIISSLDIFVTKKSQLLFQNILYQLALWAYEDTIYVNCQEVVKILPWQKSTTYCPTSLHYVSISGTLWPRQDFS
jgi:hypothetical protein